MTALSLDLSAFPQFLEEVHGHRPFPWQLRLAETVFDTGWPKALDVPTGAGKTSTIDVAVFHLACQIDPTSLANRRAAARILFVVDRRIVVDDVYRHAKRIADAVEHRRGPVTRLVAERLGALAEPRHRPLEVARLRGGAPKEPDWVRTPAQPTIVASTVDQVGSRLLFRGYGVSASMRPVHAGLLGRDALILLDEAHLAQPFATTAREIDAHQRSLTSTGIQAVPLQVVTLSATQVELAPELLSDADREDSVLGRRLLASKPARLVSLTCKSDSPEHIQAIVGQASELYDTEDGVRPQTMAVILNRVRRARRVFETLQEKVPDTKLVLLIGRARPLARNQVVEDVLPRIRAGRDDAAEDPAQTKPVIVVATQCIEAGADLDFDALVTEIAPLDALRQRCGRLDRMGRRSTPAPARIVAASDQVGRRAKPDPVYDEASAETWSWLVDHASNQKKEKARILEIDFGVQASEAWLPSDPSQLSTLVSPRKNAPEVQSVFIDRWSRTSPAPTDEADVSLFLHGAESNADVQIIWRADLDRPARSLWRDRVAACPPSTLEAVSVPIWEARRWLQGLGGYSELDDLEVSPQPEGRESRRRARQVLRWRGTAEESKLIYATYVLPGDVLIVPAADGGCDEWGWNPASRAPVEDLAFAANREHRNTEIVRLSPRILELDVLRDTRTSHGQGVEDSTGESDEISAAGPIHPDEGLQEKARALVWSLEELLPELVDATDQDVIERLRHLRELPDHWRDVLDASDVSVRRAEASPEEEGEASPEAGLPLALVRRIPGRATGEATTEDDAGSRGSRCSVALNDHSHGVAELAQAFAEQCGLSELLVRDVELAAYLHDAGKAHGAFKAWLYGGDELASRIGPPLAKSGRRYLPPRARRLARLPKGARHEVASLAFAQAHPKLREANDPALVLWLIGTHHGWGRPFFPGVDWPLEGDTIALDIGDGCGRVEAKARPLAELTACWVELRDDLTRRYGAWGLARLEAIVRLADHRRSEKEQEPNRDGRKQEQAEELFGGSRGS